MANTCQYYNYDSGFFGMGNTCSVSGEKKAISENYYRSYCCNDYNMSCCPIYKQYGPYVSSGCFITTVTCEILGNPDDSQVMNDLRRFRDEVLQKDEKYYEILKEYDVVGPELADCIRNDKDREMMAKGLYENALLPIRKLILNNEYDKAVEKYYIMTLMLVSYYGLKHEYNSAKDQDYGCQEFHPDMAGHGKPDSHKLVKVRL